MVQCKLLITLYILVIYLHCRFIFNFGVEMNDLCVAKNLL